jgi:hypothetical protein
MARAIRQRLLALLLLTLFSLLAGMSAGGGLTSATAETAEAGGAPAAASAVGKKIPGAPAPSAASAESQERVMDVTLVPAPASGPDRQPAATPAPPPGGRESVRGRAPAKVGEPLPALWLAALVVATVFLGGRIAWRRRRLRCLRCRARMERLARVDAFAHLDLAERTEQLIGEVHHEVWRCPGCGEIAKRAKERPLPEAARGIAPPVGSAAHRHRLSRESPSLFPGGLDGGESAGKGEPAASSHAAGAD